VTDQLCNLLRLDGEAFELGETSGKWPEFAARLRVARAP